MTEQIEREVAQLQVRVQEREKREEHLEKEIDELKKEVHSIQSLMTRWHGVFIAVVGIGAFIGWVLSQATAWVRR